MTFSNQHQLPRITIITPTFNQANYIERTICSILDQGYENLEYFIVDGGSTDGTMSIIDIYRDELTSIDSSSDLNAAHAINKAFKKSTGDIVAILSSDDIYLPGTLHNVAEHFRKNQDSNWLIGNIQRIDAHDNSLGKFTAQEPDSFANFLINDTGYTSGAATFFRRNAVSDRAELLNPKLRYAHEFELACDLFTRHHGPSMIKQTLTAKREHNLSNSATYTFDRGEEFINVTEDYIDLLPMTERYNVWQNCQQRRDIFKLARAESQVSQTRNFLWKQLLRRPSWLASDNYRHSLLTGVAQQQERKAA
ncbi:glycosyltransferase [Poriferisphaera sp. WC338]|uniref:glycosyltransferase n=1 Tax=Poriferisphaera sp. WC338 TaxID=3425129 RepID=UPI003D81AE93